MPPRPRLLTTGEAARELSVSRQTLGSWWRDGLVTPTEVTAGGHARWDLDDLRAQLRALRQAETDTD